MLAIHFLLAIGSYQGKYPLTKTCIRDDRIIGAWSMKELDHHYDIFLNDYFYEVKHRITKKNEGKIYISKVNNTYMMNLLDENGEYMYAKYDFNNQGDLVITAIDGSYDDGTGTLLQNKKFDSQTDFLNFFINTHEKSTFFSETFEDHFKKIKPRGGRDYAVFFTAHEYDNSAWQPLPNIPKEVRLLANDLSDMYSFNVRTVPNATYQDIINILKEYENSNLYDSDSQLLLFFSMHGQRTPDNQGYLIPRDGGKRVSEKWLSHTVLSDIVNELPCPRILVSIDACYSGVFGANRGKPPTPDWEIAKQDCAMKRRMAFEEVHLSRKYITAGRADDLVPSDGKFAARWHRALQSKGGEDGILSLGELWATLDQVDVVRPTNGNFGSGKIKGDFAFVCNTCCFK